MSSKQKLAIFLSVMLAVLLYFAPKTLSEKQTANVENNDFISSFGEANKNISPEQKQIFTRLEQELIKAQDSSSEANWLMSATDFLKAARLIQDDKKALLYKGAINGYEKVLQIAPANLSAKTGLGTAIVESSSLLGNQPMKGISLLREVIQQDSNNIDANLQLGLFSVTSQQFDKAIERFKRILRIDSTRVDMYVYLGDTYTAMGNKPKAIESYENYKIRIKDSLIVNDIEAYIKKLKQQPN